ncbi:hypothetical protein GCM10022393_12820 [Aquimarina addita]|uniref:Membrane or secreted protein n=1 Tax=Aquimarina addita TaxID=870485 RepID=A0ABP7XEG3_9FLAO
MIFRILLIVLVIGGIYLFVKNMLGTTDFKKCGKCDGRGYWIAMRGERDKCDVCKGAGKVSRKI